MKYIGWIISAVLVVVVAMNQMTIHNYKLACQNYREAIAIYESKPTNGDWNVREEKGE